MQKPEKEGHRPCGKCGMRLGRAGEYWHDMDHRFNQSLGKVMVRACTCPDCARLRPQHFICPVDKKPSVLSEKFYVAVI